MGRINYKGINIELLVHDTVIIKSEEVNDEQVNNDDKKIISIIIDPFKISKKTIETIDKIDFVLITHEHFDHCSPEDIQKVINENTVIIANEGSKECLLSFNNKKYFFKPFESHDFNNFELTTIPAYNINKYRNPEQKIVYHPKADAKLGFLITINGITIYHAGDTDLIPEMKDIVCDVALLPVSGTYVMTPEEASEAVKILKPDLIIPMHYGTIVGNKNDAEKLKSLLPEFNVKILL